MRDVIPASKTHSSVSPSSSTDPHIELRRIVVGFPLGETTRPLLKTANAIANEFSAELFVIHSIAPTPTTLGMVGETPEARTEILESTQKKIEKILQREGVTVPFHVSVELDSPTTALHNAVKQHQADLVIVGSRGRHGFEQLIEGSVSQSIADRVKCPVLILGPSFAPDQNLFQTILLATDLDKTGYGAAQWAAAIAVGRDCRLILLHVARQKSRSENRTREWVEENITEKLYRLLEKQVRCECDHEALIAYGDPGQEILAVADNKRADLIVLGLGGERKLMNDHASWRTLTTIVKHARCPVLIVGS
jgi:nucleotide-binding universal stress UspA family protein